MVVLRNTCFDIENPLFNRLILSELFKYCSPEDLKMCRLVCQLWYQESQSEWASRVPITVKWSEIKEFLSNKYPTLKKPHRSYKVSLCCLTTSNFEKEEGSKFWKKCGRWVTHLELNYCPIYCIDETLTLLRKHLPNLKSLIWAQEAQMAITQPYRIRVERLAEDLSPVNALTNLKSLDINLLPRISWNLLLPQVPKLEILKIQRSREVRASVAGSDIGTLFRTIKLVRENNQDKLALKYLDIVDFFVKAISTLDGQEPYSVSELSELDLPLETLKMDIGWKTQPSKVHLVLRAFQKSLRALEIFQVPQNPRKARNFLSGEGVNMKCLEELRLLGCLPYNMSFLREMPKLRILRISKGCQGMMRKMEHLRWSDVSGIKHTGQDLVKVKFGKLRMDSLTELDMDYQFTSENLRTLSKLMPNLRILRVILNNETLSELSTLWSALEELKAGSGSTITDDGILEMGQMNYLHTFELEPCCKHVKLTSNSVENGFLLKMPNLAKLNIKVSIKMTRQSVVQLKRHILRVQVRRTTDNGAGCVENCCCTLGLCDN